MPAGLKHLTSEVITLAQWLVELLRDVLDASFLVEVQLELVVLVPCSVTDVEVAVEEPSQEVVGARTGANRELVEDALVFVELAQLGLERFKNLDGFDRLVGHFDVPHLHVEEVSTKDVATVLGKGDVTDTRYDLREEILVGAGLLLLVDDGCVVANAAFSEITHFDEALGGGENEEIVMARVELGGCDHLVELLEVVRLQVDDVEGDLCVFQVPEVDSEVVTGYEVLAVAGHGNGVDMVRVEHWEFSLEHWCPVSFHGLDLW
jgi:hypothetical protein